MSRRLLYYYLLFFIVLWFILPIFIIPTIPLDSAENIMWGNALSWGYYKHPPLVAWILHFLMLVFHNPRLATYLASAIAVALCLIYVYRLSCIFLTKNLASFAVILTTLIYYYTFPSMQFNQDIIMLPLWAMLCFYTYHALSGKQWTNWYKVGILAGLSLLAKYESIVILTALFCFFIFNRQYHKTYIIKKLCLAILIMLIIILPNIIWVFNHDFLPIKYMLDSGDTSGNFFYRRLMNLQAVVITQISAILLALLIIWFSSKRSSLHKTKYLQHFLFWIGFGPLLISILLVLILGIQIKGYWAIPYFNFTITAILFFSQRQLKNKALRKIFIFSIIWNLLLCGTVFSYAYYNKRNLGPNYPAKQIANYVDKLWYQHYHTRLNYIIADRSNSSNISAYSHFSPQALINFDLQISPWLTLAKLKVKGGIIIVNNCVKVPPSAITHLLEDVQYVGCKEFTPILKYHTHQYYRRTFFIVPPEKSH